MGFWMPLREWLRGDLDFHLDALESRPVTQVIEPSYVGAVRAEHAAGRDRTAVVHGVAFLDFWLERWA
jgi:hypothetical protein